MSTSLTKEYLLLSAGEFDIETIFHLELDNRDVQRMMGLQICTNIVRVDLSRNQIIRIEALENLSKLQFLDLSHNKLSKLAGIGSATGLETLRILNNPISRNVDVADLAMCEKLRAVFFQGVNGKDCCPICLQPDYRSRMLELVPNLISLDGTIFLQASSGLRNFRFVFRLWANFCSVSWTCDDVQTHILCHFEIAKNNKQVRDGRRHSCPSTKLSKTKSTWRFQPWIRFLTFSIYPCRTIPRNM